MSGAIELRQGDCVEVMRGMPDASVDAVVTDPPYGLEFMGNEWDSFGGVSVTQGGEYEPPAPNGYMKKGSRGATIAASRVGLPAFQKWSQEWATEALRVLKPGGHAVVFGGTRTYHRMVCGLEDAGFEIRDQLAWMFGSGFPKSLDVSKAIDAAAGAERTERVDERWLERYPNGPKGNTGVGAAFDGNGLGRRDDPITTSDPVTAAARRWQGWGTALKPGYEPVVLARKPLVGTVAANVLAHGVGALNVDGTRISSGQLPTMEAWENDANLCDSCAADADETPRRTAPATKASTAQKPAAQTTNGKDEQSPGGISKVVTGCSAGQSPEAQSTVPSDDGSSSTAASGRRRTGRSQTGVSSITSTGTSLITDLRTCNSCGAEITTPTITEVSPSGRWPSNVVLDPDAAAMLDEQSGELVAGAFPTKREARTDDDIFRAGWGTGQIREERIPMDSGGASRFFYCAKVDTAERNAGLAVPSLFSQDGPDRNTHPTVKPVDLMRWLCRLVTPPGGLVLDPFMGSGSTGIAAFLEGFDFVGVEREPEYMEIARARLSHWCAQEVEVA